MTSIKQAIIKYSKLIPASEVRIFLQHITALSLEKLLLQQDEILSKEHFDILTKYCQRRIQGEPVSYIIGLKEFFGLEFFVNDKVLIPRPETELMVEEALKFLMSKNNALVLDICCGSSCIGASIAYNNKNLKIIGADISEDALCVANNNIRKLELEKNILLVQSDWFKNINLTNTSIKNFIDKDELKFDLICCNPPYIPQSDISLMSKETIKYEPHLALFAANNGLAAYQVLAANSQKFLKENGQLIIECGFNQAPNIITIFENYGWVLARIVKDLSGFDRCICFKSKIKY